MSRPDSLPHFLIRVYDLYLSRKFCCRLWGKAFYHDLSQYENPTTEEIKFNNSEIITWECACFLLDFLPLWIFFDMFLVWFLSGCFFEILHPKALRTSLTCKMIMSHNSYKQDALFFHPVWLNKNLAFIFLKKKKIRGFPPLKPMHVSVHSI